MQICLLSSSDISQVLVISSSYYNICIYFWYMFTVHHLNSCEAITLHSASFWSVNSQPVCMAIASARTSWDYDRGFGGSFCKSNISYLTADIRMFPKSRCSIRCAAIFDMLYVLISGWPTYKREVFCGSQLPTSPQRWPLPVSIIFHSDGSPTSPFLRGASLTYRSGQYGFVVRIPHVDNFQT